MALQNPLGINVDSDGQITGLKVVDGTTDHLAVSSLERSFVEDVSSVYKSVSDTSAIWDEGGSPSAAGFEGWNSTEATVDAGATGWDTTKSTVDDGATGWDSTEATVDTGATGWNSTEATVDDGAANWDAIYGDRTNIRSVSGSVTLSATAWLNGTGVTPTLGAGLECGGFQLKEVGTVSANNVKCNTLSTNAADFIRIAGASVTPVVSGAVQTGPTAGGLVLSATEFSSTKMYTPLPVIKGDTFSSVYVSGYGPGDDVKNNVAGGFGYVYNSTINRFVLQELLYQPPTNASIGAFATPSVMITNSNVSRVDMTADLSTGVGVNATFGGDVFFSGGTISVCSQDSVATMTGALPAIDTLVCPSPPGAFCFLSAVGDGTAGTSEISFGEGTTVQGVSSTGRAGGDGYYLWEAAANELEVSADGVYKVEFVGITEVAAAITITVSFYTGATLVHRFDIRVHSVTDPHNLVGSWVGFVQTSTPISVTINSGSGDNAQLMQSSTMFVQRLA